MLPPPMTMHSSVPSRATPAPGPPPRAPVPAQPVQDLAVVAELAPAHQGLARHLEQHPAQPRSPRLVRHHPLAPAILSPTPRSWVLPAGSTPSRSGAGELGDLGREVVRPLLDALAEPHPDEARHLHGRAQLLAG